MLKMMFSEMHVFKFPGRTLYISLGDISTDWHVQGNVPVLFWLGDEFIDTGNGILIWYYVLHASDLSFVLSNVASE